MQLGDLRAVEEAPFPLPEIAKFDATEPDASEPFDGHADLRQHASDLALPALSHHDLEERLPSVFLSHSDPSWTGRAIIELHALTETTERFTTNGTGHERQVGPLDSERWVQQPMGQVTIVGEQEQSFGVLIESSDGVEPLVQVDEVHHGRPSFGVAGGGDDALWLVQHQVAHSGVDDDALTVDLYHVRHSVHSVAQGGDLAVDRHAAGDDEHFRGPPGGDPGRCKDFLEAISHGPCLPRPAPHRSLPATPHQPRRQPQPGWP